MAYPEAVRAAVAFTAAGAGDAPPAVAEDAVSTAPPPTQPTFRGLPRPVAVLVGLAAAVVALAGVREIAGLVGPSLLAVVLVVTLDPLRDAVRRRGAPEWLSIAALLAAAYAILVALVAALVLSVSQLAVLLPRYAPQFRDIATRVGEALEPLGVTPDQITGIVNDIDLSNFVGWLQLLLGRATSVASSLLLVVVLVLFLCIEGETFARRLAGSGVRPELVGALRDFARRTRRYMVVSSVFGLIVAVIDVAMLWVLGVPAPLVWGLLSFVTNYVPNVGFLLGVAPPALMALLEGGVGPMVAVIVAYSVVNFAIQTVIQPKIVGDAVGLSATVTFLSVVFWAIVLGSLGGLLAVPLTLLVKAIFLDADPDARWVNPLIGDVRPELAGPGPRDENG